VLVRVLLVAALVLSLTAIPANAQTPTYCDSVIVDPLWQLWWQSCGQWGIWEQLGFGSTSCKVIPLVQVGDPTSLNGYRDGVYFYSCNETLEYHTTTAIQTPSPVVSSSCIGVPYVAVAGAQIPGTDATYCSAELNISRTMPVDSWDGAPISGIFFVYTSASCGDCYGWIPSWQGALMNDCQGDHPSQQLSPAPAVNTSAASAEVDCNYPRHPGGSWGDVARG